MIRVAFVHKTFPAGGAERITIDIARYLSGIEGYEVFVYVSRINDFFMTDEISRTMSVRVLSSRLDRSAEIEKLIVRDSIDVLVQVAKSLPDIDGIRKRTGCKVVLACHGEPFFQRYAITNRRQKGFFRKLMWNLYNRRRFEDGTLAMRMARERTLKDYSCCDAYTVLCSSYKSEVEEALGIDPSMSHVFAIENPERQVDDVNLDKEKILMFCGRFENWSKRIDRLLRIWAKAQKSLPDWNLVLVGDGKDGKMLRQMARQLGLERISFEGAKSSVAEYYRKSSVVCLTSQTEGWPLALSEAQAHGCIGIAFGSTSGICEILSPDGECGFIVPPFDEDRYVATLERIAALDKEDELRIRRKALEKRREYVPDVIAQKWKMLFDLLCQSSK